MTKNGSDLSFFLSDSVSLAGCFVCMHTDNRAAMFHNAGAINNSGDWNCNTSNQHSL
jgi:hypothetical protein